MRLVKIDLILNIYVYIGNKGKYEVKPIQNTPMLPEYPYNRQEVIVSIPRSVLNDPITVGSNRSIEFEDKEIVFDLPHNCVLVYIKEQNTWLIQLI